MEKLIEIHEYICECKHEFKKCKTEKEKKEMADNIMQLEEIWKQLTECDYPMLKNSNGKEMNIKNVIQKQIADKKKNRNQEYKLPSLDDIINRTTNDTRLINNVLYDKNFASDEVDHFRKRKKK
jgi:hypothetical protein